MEISVGKVNLEIYGTKNFYGFNYYQYFVITRKLVSSRPFYFNFYVIWNDNVHRGKKSVISIEKT